MFTPGPWKVHGAPPPEDNCRDISANGRLVAVTSGMMDAKQDEANARLIASAPELFAAFKAAVEGLVAMEDVSWTWKAGDFAGDAEAKRAHEVEQMTNIFIDEARALIQRIEGEDTTA